MRPRLLTLDLDDTLWPIAPVIREAERTLLGWLAERLPRHRAEDLAARIVVCRAAVAAERADLAHDLTQLRLLSLRRALADIGADPSLAEPALEVFLAARHQVALYPEVEAALARLARRLPVVALSNGNACVRRLGLGDYFVGSWSARDHGAMKPDPSIFLAACARHGVAPEHTLHVGDHPVHDVEGARGAGLAAAWLCREAVAAWPRPTPPPLRFGCLHALADWLEAEP